MSEPSRERVGEGYGASDDEAVIPLPPPHPPGSAQRQVRINIEVQSRPMEIGIKDPGGASEIRLLRDPFAVIQKGAGTP